ncbi:DNA polymerase III subunit chi [Paracoccus ravus]|uniref:DNA polymerase III subunit chi n=1 Tax=Paracoccus ravus TaxID=2447760 RepID=UPI00106DFAD0|nr:DNA polymerase III subunit chi [Paracoccus ravus]
MGSALFYHLTRSGPGQLLPTLLGKSLQAGWRVELRGRDPARLAALDEMLWQDEGFLPHGLAGGAHDARQPILLTVEGQAAQNAPLCLVTLEGAGISAAECAALERVCVIFDGNDPEALERARGQWRDLKAEGAEMEYWSEADGRWERKL